MTVIKNGVGNGDLAKVDENNRLYTNAISQSVEHNSNFEFGRSYSWVVSQTPTGANDFFLYMKNTGSLPIVLEGMDYRVASAEQIKVYLGRTGTPSGGTTATIANLNTASSNQPTGTFEAGNDITGTSAGTVVYHYYLTSTETKAINFDQDIVIKPGGVFMMEAITGSIAINLNLNFFESNI
jgi:hypothetical protein